MQYAEADGDTFFFERGGELKTQGEDISADSRAVLHAVRGGLHFSFGS
jgi:hypothetical protein